MAAVTGGEVGVLTNFPGDVIQPALAALQPVDTTAGVARTWTPAPYPAEAAEPGNRFAQQLAAFAQRMTEVDEGMRGTMRFQSAFFPLAAASFTELDQSSGDSLRSLISGIEQQVPRPQTANQSTQAIGGGNGD